MKDEIVERLRRAIIYDFSGEESDLGIQAAAIIEKLFEERDALLVANQEQWQLRMKAESDIDKMRDDAERYKWMKTNYNNRLPHMAWWPASAYTRDTVDEAIDTARIQK